MDNLYRKTSIMGWTSWNCFGTNIAEESLKIQVEALKATGLDKCGCIYFNTEESV